MATSGCTSFRMKPRRNVIRWPLHLTLCVWLVGQLAIVESSWAAEVALSLIGIEIDGRAENTVSDVAVIPPGQSKAEKRTLRIGAAIEQGTEIILPRRTVLVLKSANGNQVRLQPGSRFKVHVVGSEGETYSLLVGQALFKVSRTLNFFNVNYESFLAIVRGTEFDMEVEPGREIRFRLTEGRLVVQREVKVKILEGNKVAQLTASDILAKGKKTEVSYRLGVEEYLKEFKTFKDAEEYFRRQLKEDEKSMEYERIQHGLNDLGMILWTIGKLREAITNYQRALEAAHDRRDENWEASLLNNLGIAYYDLGENRRAIEYYEKALELEFKLHPDGVNSAIASVYDNLGNAWRREDEYRRAIGYHEKALELEFKLHPEGMHWGIAASYTSLGNAYHRLGENHRAIEYHEKALELMFKLYPDGVHPGIAGNYNNLGIAYEAMGQNRRAIEYHEKALAVWLKLYPDGMHPAIGGSYNNLGNAYFDLGEYRRAIGCHEKALALRLKFYPDGLHPYILQSYRNLSVAYLAGGELDRAAEYEKNADEIERKLKR